MLSVQEAIEHSLHNVAVPEAFASARLHRAGGRVLAADLFAPGPLPAASLATMDGFALHSADVSERLRIVGSSMAGQPHPGKVARGQTVRIATGALVPDGLDCVMPIEQARVDGKQAAFTGPAAGNIRIRGEELAAGAVAVAAGTLLESRQLGLLASLGIDRVPVYSRPRVGLLATGDELRTAGETLAAGSIHESGRLMLSSLLAELGFAAVDLGIARDREDDLAAALDRAGAECDVIATIGGASVGSRDLIGRILEKRGRIRMWKVAMKPGKPFIIGSYRDRPVYGLPGNPVSAYVCMMMLVVPALWKAAGRSPLPQWPRLPAAATERMPGTEGRAEYRRGRASRRRCGTWQVSAQMSQNSAALTGLAAANCLIELAAGQGEVAKGDPVTIIALPGALAHETCL